MILLQLISIIGDIHSNLMNLKEALRISENYQVNKYFFLGDYILDGYHANEVLELIKKQNAIVIKGNKEEFFDFGFDENWSKYKRFQNIAYCYRRLTKENLEYIRNLPQFQVTEIEGVKICLSHGSPDNTREIVEKNNYLLFDKLIEKYKCQVYIFAHSHVAFSVYYRNCLFINPGSISIPSDGPSAKFGFLKIEDGSFSYQPITFDYDFEEIKKYYQNSDYLRKVDSYAKLLLLNIRDGYDHVKDFIELLNKRATEKGIDITLFTPDNLWDELYFEYMKKYDTNQEISKL